MTERESFEASETKQNMLSGFPVCCVCHEAFSTQLAHRISQGKRSRHQFSKSVIHHRWNLVPVCGLACNSKVVIDNKPKHKDLLVFAIMRDLCGHKGAIGMLRKLPFVAHEVFT
jgi:hypothetical protein